MEDHNTLSDEEFMKSFDSINENIIAEHEAEENKESEETDATEEEVVEDTEEEKGTVETETEETDEEEEANDPDRDEADSDEEEETEETIEDTGKEEPDEEESLTEYEKEYKRILSPFKANGKEMKVGSVDDAITLMQKGAGFEQKMEVLKPQLKIIKALENNKLLDMDKISYLIDIHNKNPEAITKLLKESEIDPLDLNTDEVTDYKPKDHSVSDKEYELSQTLDSLQSREGFQEVIKVVTNSWDDASRQFVVDNPSILEVLTEHKESGVFDAVMSKVNNEKMLGRLKDVNASEAYKTTLDKMLADGTLNQNSDTPTEPEVKQVTKKPDVERNKKRKAAGVTKGRKTSKQQSSVEDDAKLSDEEFLKKYF